MDLQTQRELLWLEALQQAGVDNWEGCSEAQNIYEELLDEAGLADT